MSKFIKLNSKIIYQNNFAIVYLDKLQNGSKKFDYVYFSKPKGKAVVIIPFQDNGVFLIKQFRYPIRQAIWQLPAGTLEDNQELLDLCKLELQEEAGLIARHFKRIGSFYGEPGMSTQEDLVFLATNLKKTSANMDYNEDIQEIKFFSLEELREMIAQGKINCAFTLSALNIFFNQIPQ